MSADTPEHDGSDLKKIREEIDELKAVGTEQLIDPQPASLLENGPHPTPTDSIGSEDWNDPKGAPRP